MKDKDIKVHTHNFFDYIINIRKIDLNRIKINEKSQKNILIYCIIYVTIEDSKNVKILKALYTLLLVKWIGTLKKLIKISICR